MCGLILRQGEALVGGMTRHPPIATPPLLTYLWREISGGVAAPHGRQRAGTHGRRGAEVDELPPRLHHATPYHTTPHGQEENGEEVRKV